MSDEVRLVSLVTVLSEAVLVGEDANGADIELLEVGERRGDGERERRGWGGEEGKKEERKPTVDALMMRTAISPRLATRILLNFFLGAIAADASPRDTGLESIVTGTGGGEVEGEGGVVDGSYLFRYGSHDHRKWWGGCGWSLASPSRSNADSRLPCGPGSSLASPPMPLPPCPPSALPPSHSRNIALMYLYSQLPQPLIPTP